VPLLLLLRERECTVTTATVDTREERQREIVASAKSESVLFPLLP
jgi:hypothetical protein